MTSFLSDFYPSKKSNLKTSGAYKRGMKVSFHTFIKFRSFDEEKDVKEILSAEENSVTEEAFAKLNNVQNPPMLNSRRIIEEHKKRLNLSPYSSYPSPTSSYTSPTTSSYKSTYLSSPSSSLYPSRSSRALNQSSLNNRYNNSYSVSTTSFSTPTSPTYTRKNVYASTAPLSSSSTSALSPTSSTYSRPSRFLSSLTTTRFSGSSSPSSNYLR